MSRAFIRLVNVGLGMTFVLLLLNAAVSYRNILQRIDNERRVSQSYQTIAALEKLLSTLKDAETGQRGYLLTGKERYLEPYNTSVAEINQQVQTLRQLESPLVQPQQIQSLEQAIATKLAELEQTIQLRRTQGFDAAQRVVQSDRGKQIMDQIRQRIVAIENQENQQLHQRIQESQQSLNSTLLSLILVTGASLLLLAAGAVALHQAAKQQTQAEQALREQEERLRLFTLYAPVSVAMFDKAMRYLALSQRWADDYHLGSIENVLGKSHYDVFPNIPERWRQIHQRGLAGQSQKCEDDSDELPDGSQQYLRWEVQPWFDSNNNVNGILIFVEDVTNKKLIETALRESEQQFRATFDQAAVGIAYVAPDGSWLQVNHKLCQIVGYRQEELRQCTFQQITYPADLDKDLDYVQQMLTGQIQTYTMEKRYIHKNGSPIWINLTVALVREADGQPKYFISVVEDINERKLAQLNEQFLLILDQQIRRLPDADSMAYEAVRQLGEHLDADRCFWGQVSDGDSVTVEQDWRRQNVASIVGAYALSDFIQPELITLLQKGEAVICPDLATGPPAASFAENYARLNIRAFVVVPCIVEGNWVALLTVQSTTPRLWQSYDVTLLQEGVVRLWSVIAQTKAIQNLRASEERLRQLNLTLEQRVVERTAELEESNHELEAFSYSVSHDLRAPLRIMQGFSQALQEDYVPQLDDVARSYLASIANSAVQMDDLINGLLDYSRLSRTQIELQPTNLNHVVEVALQQLQSQIQEQQAIITVAPNLPTVLAHRLTLVQVMANLIGNAIKFVAVSVQPQVSVFAEINQSWVRLWVVDNGIGMAANHHRRIFRVFERLHGVETYPGTGIGLAIVQKGIERMGGQVGVESQLGSGSQFWIALPRADSITSP
jgi:PAS domain S-box-containing protein